MSSNVNNITCLDLSSFSSASHPFIIQMLVYRYEVLSLVYIPADIYTDIRLIRFLFLVRPAYPIQDIWLLYQLIALK